MGYYNPSPGYEPAGEPKKLRSGTFSKVILLAVILTVLVYTFAVLMISLCGAVVPDSLTYCFFGFFGTEVLSLVTIKVKKLKREVIYNAVDRETEGCGLRGDFPENGEADTEDAGRTETNPADD